MRKQNYKTKRSFFDYIPHILSSLALIVSMLVGLNQIRTNNINSEELDIQRNLINIANFDNDNSLMYISPYSNEFTLLDNTLFYPINGKIGSKRFDKTDNHTTTRDMQDYLRKIIMEKGNSLIIPGTFLDYNGYPILIGTKYIYHGKTNEIVAMYYVSFYATQINKDNLIINFKNIEYIRNMDKKTNTAEYLMAVFYRNFGTLFNMNK